MVQITEEIRAKAEIYVGDEIGQEKTKFLLKEVGLPNGLLPLKDIEECGYVEETGFVWLKQKKKIDHKFEEIGRPVQYATEITAVIERGKGVIKKLTGVKAKEMMIWLTISDIYIEKKSPEKITFKAPTGLSRTFPVSAFLVEEPATPKAANKVVVPVAAPEANKVVVPVAAPEAAPAAAAAVEVGVKEV